MVNGCKRTVAAYTSGIGKVRLCSHNIGVSGAQAGLLITQQGPACYQEWRGAEAQLLCLRSKELQVVHEPVRAGGWSPTASSIYAGRNDVELEGGSTQERGLIDQGGSGEIGR